MNEPIKLSDLNSALDRLKEGVNEATNDLDRDGVIQRFEFTFELVWKTVQEYAKYKGLEVVSPRDSFRVAADLGIIDNPEIWFDFLKDRNESTHLYSEDQAKSIFSHIPSFINEVEKLLSNISQDK
ncbi:MAG: nucleotidyltransferase [Anaerolinea sp.]|nr:nucleotidyltransferase [Anaerolinea sp.]